MMHDPIEFLLNTAPRHTGSVTDDIITVCHVSTPQITGNGLFAIVYGSTMIAYAIILTKPSCTLIQPRNIGKFSDY